MMSTSFTVSEEIHPGISRLALGTVQFGLAYGIANRDGQVSRLSAQSMLEFANGQGINTVDTAIGYGESEHCLGQVGVAGFNVITKLPALPENRVNVREWVSGELEASMLRLGVKQVDALLLHRPLELLGEQGAELFDALSQLKEAALVKKIGISIYSPEELQLLMPKFDLDLVQGPFNLIDRRLFNSGWFGRLKDRGVEIHVRSAFLQGLLLMSRDMIPEKFSRWDSVWDQWHHWLAKNEMSALNACLAFALSFAEIDRVVVGADSLAQLQQITAAAQSPVAQVNFPDLAIVDEQLINPANWPHL